ncbi:cyclase family protein [Leucobacter denitrificans]|uniref:Cyclase family protein n=1 Tax=Leucobacter denitrificans TaxID=683042 RepID=A0A7G9S456_9MICO|nr:cyclase family protein [Leucobacter denitrificans]QNN62631.1 cyclase family protein [Leucobacter denitrificans]
MRFVDLSHPIATGMPVYPGDPEVAIEHALTIDTDGVAVDQLSLGSHSGTHLDAPSHSIVGGRTVDELSLEQLWGRARVLRASVDPGSEIGVADLEIPDRLPGIVVVSTGWDAYFGTSAAIEHPNISLDLAKLLWSRGARVLGVDTLSPDATGSEVLDMPVHEFWLGNDGVIVENLRGLGAIPDEVEVSMLPLRLAGVDGSPVRVVARFNA